ncbi:hypothetical protein [Streptomyces sp. NPDC059994]|uniref:hypothetical protein n=1 Tax=Streptomyces sp. NPDC059994 TaxID=3347029 RepID=UPI00367B3C15
MSDYDDMTNADVMSASEMAEYERDAEFALDAADEREALEREKAEEAAMTSDGHECQAEFIDGSWDYCGCDDCNDREAADAEEWRPGQCDRCYGETVSGPLGDVHCACAIGQGADPEDCQCGPEDDSEAAS